jgi:imidazolonepropionase-like amidohydrolase
VTVVDTRTGALAPHRTVLIREGRITSVGTAAPPVGAILVRGSGKFLIPGLWDMLRTESRPSATKAAETAVWAAAVRAGTLTGPTIFQVGPRRPRRCAGVILLAGTDIAGDRVPGFSLHEELDELSVAGLSPLQVLQAATLNPSIAMKRTADYGTVEAGKIADLVLLDADPTQTVSALHRIDQVFLHGKPLNRAAIRDLLRKARAEAEKS